MTDNVKVIASHPTRSDFAIEEVVEAGIVLTGTEIKSLRSQAPSLRDAFVDIQSPSSTEGHAKHLEAFLLHLHIPPYSHGNIWNHDPTRPRKLLLHKNQVEQLYGALTRGGKTVVPLRLYLKKGLAKIEIGIGKAKKKHDKREDSKKKAMDRDIQSAMKRKL